MTLPAVERDIKDGAPIIIVPTQRRIVHLPAERRATYAQPVTLDEVLEAGGIAHTWATRCGERGGVFVYTSLFYTRVPCEKCMAEQAA